MPSVVEHAPRPRPAPTPDAVTQGQTDEIFRLMAELDELDPATDWGAWCRSYVGEIPFNKLDKTGADRLIAGLMQKADELGPPPTGSKDSP
jgi:hypothetical protein